ncbi:hypothetical protein [Salinibacterium sp. ZJ454]|uniref:hypothetical protein n=1 Tax=Salinibacterium sp. ZJ454 TaxID=2708339 RepID=UPI001421DBFE|nr:hypothetical protein [Salinibacterium sp. ZJ454]
MPRSRPAPTRWARVVRGWSTAAAATLIAAVAHGLVDGAFPQLIAMVFAVVFGGLVCMLFAGRRITRLRLGLMVLTSQGILHMLFALFGPGGGSHTAGTGLTGTGLVDAAHHQTALIVAPTAAPDAHADMWLLHGVAALATYTLIRHGLVVIAGLVVTAGLIVAPLLRAAQLAPVSIAGRGRLAVSATRVPRALGRVLTAFRRRGPPAAAFA